MVMTLLSGHQGALSPYRSASRAKPGCRRASRRAGPAGRGSIPRQTIHRLAVTRVGGQMSSTACLDASTSGVQLLSEPSSSLRGCMAPLEPTTAEVWSDRARRWLRWACEVEEAAPRRERRAPGMMACRMSADATDTPVETASLGDLPDEALMEAFRDGRAEAFEILTRRHKNGLFGFLYRSVNNRARAEELLQEVFLRVIRARERYVVTAKFTTWLYTIARNLCIDESRRAKFRRHRSLDAPMAMKDGDGPTLHERLPAPQVGTDDAAQAPTIRDRVAQAVAALPEEQREVFIMRQVRGMSFKQIGEVVGASENTAKSRMRYALEKLRTHLADIDPRQASASTKKEGCG